MFGTTIRNMLLFWPCHGRAALAYPHQHSYHLRSENSLCSPADQHWGSAPTMIVPLPAVAVVYPAVCSRWPVAWTFCSRLMVSLTGRLLNGRYTSLVQSLNLQCSLRNEYGGRRSRGAFSIVGTKRLQFGALPVSTISGVFRVACGPRLAQ